MASQKDSSTSSGHKKRGSQDSRGFDYFTGEDTRPAGDNRAPNQPAAESSPPKESSGTFIQFERVDVDPLQPIETNQRLTSPLSMHRTESDASRGSISGQSDRDSPLASSRKSDTPQNPKNMQAKPGKRASGGGNAKRSGANNSGYLKPPLSRAAGDPTVGAKLASHSPEREEGQPLQGYSFTPHDCQIRSPGGISAAATSRCDNPKTTVIKIPPGAVKLPVPVPSKHNERSRPSSTASTSTVTTGAAHTSTTTSPSSTPGGSDMVTPDCPSGHVIIRQPGAAVSQKTTEPVPGVSSNLDVTTRLMRKKSKEADAKTQGVKSKNQLNGIPQTNFMIGLLVTCCFNPPLGLIAMAISLRAAEAYRDGDNKKGACRARASIIISLFSIMITMVVVSTLLVYTAVDKHGYGKKKDPGSKSILPFGL